MTGSVCAQEFKLLEFLWHQGTTTQMTSTVLEMEIIVPPAVTRAITETHFCTTANTILEMPTSDFDVYWTKTGTQLPKRHLES
ncbi:hypothetical protein BofuT4_uP068320.1 [Botrytis cinerea T4]|uniref:Uncharacterized protein n=1 Tax=Botryotinia fuckeliana (strain T4) TaxID=999810 RepID=G2XQS9_BOTF4|nr:hypothetical protein BofuT4_uP068320.1 [Botrytis cinerea T4]